MSIDLLVGQKLGQYELREFLGKGGMGAVYLGYQASLKREVAIKILSLELSQDTEFIARFDREAQTIAALEHPHIVPVHDYGTQSGVSYVVMRFLKGGSLEDRLEDRYDTNGQMPSLSESARLLQQIGSALDYAHAQGVIHRDIKPGNIMFDTHGLPFILDFGIAKLLRESTTSLTQSGAGQLGTPIYMAPEQWLNEEIGPKTDQYALAVIVYMMITGKRPFNADTLYGLLQQHLNETPPRPHEIRLDIPPQVSAVIEKALAKKAADRYESIGEFAAAFSAAIGGIKDSEISDFFTFTLPNRPKVSPTTGFLPSFHAAPKPLYKNPLLWALLAISAVALVLVALLLTQDKQEASVTLDANQIASQSVNNVFQALTATMQEATLVAAGWTATPTSTVTASATASLTATLTATSSPSASATQTLTATITPTSTVTPSPSSTTSQTAVPVTLAPTILYPDGHRLVLLYNRVSFYVLNTSAEQIPVEFLSFEALNEEGRPTEKRFSASAWASIYSSIDPQNCVRLEISQSVGYLRPSDCAAYNAQIVRLNGDPSLFWVGEPGISEFRVLWNRAEIGRCKLDQQQCEIYVPPLG